MKSQTRRPAMRAPPMRQPTAAPAIVPAFDGQGVGVHDEVGLIVGLEVVEDVDEEVCEGAEVDAVVEALDVVVAVDVEEVGVAKFSTRIGICTREIVVGKLDTKVGTPAWLIATVALTWVPVRLARPGIVTLIAGLDTLNVIVKGYSKISDDIFTRQDTTDLVDSLKAILSA
jgi:hypothetical protein